MPFPTACLRAAALALCLAAPAGAGTLTFNYSFANAMNGGGTVSGFVMGLDEGTHAATSVWVTSNSMGWPTGEFVGSPEYNSWTVTNGALTAFRFTSYGASNGNQAVTSASLFFDSSYWSGVVFRASYNDDPAAVTTWAPGVTTADIGLAFRPASTSVAPIPLPATGLLLGAALAGAALLRRRASAAV